MKSVRTSRLNSGAPAARVLRSSAARAPGCRGQRRLDDLLTRPAASSSSHPAQRRTLPCWALGLLKWMKHTLRLPVADYLDRRETPSGNGEHFCRSCPQGIAGRGGRHSWGFFPEKSLQLNLKGELEWTHEERGEWGSGRAHFSLRGQPLCQLQRQETTGSSDLLTLPATPPDLAASPRSWPILNPALGYFFLKPGVPCHSPAPDLSGLGCEPQRLGWCPRPPAT